MKDFWKSWKFWAVVAAVVLVIVAVVLYLTIPAFAEFVRNFMLYLVTAVLGIAVGFIAGFFVAKKQYLK